MVELRPICDEVRPIYETSDFPADVFYARAPRAHSGDAQGDRATGVTPADSHHTIEAIWRIESARLVKGLARILRDVGTAEVWEAPRARNLWPQIALELPERSFVRAGDALRTAAPFWWQLIVGAK